MALKLKDKVKEHTEPSANNFSYTVLNSRNIDIEIEIEILRFISHPMWRQNVLEWTANLVFLFR